MKTTLASSSERGRGGAASVVVPGVPWKVVKGIGADSRDEPVRSHAAPGVAMKAGGAGWAKVINRRYHLTIASLAYVATTCVLVIGAVNGQNNLLFWIFGIAVSGLMISGLISGSSLMGIRVRREILDAPRAGEAFHIRYTLFNANYVVGAFALVVEELPQSRGWFGKKFVASWPARVLQPRVGVAYLGPRQTMVVECRCDAVVRGRAAFSPVRISSTFPFGIARKSVTFAQDSQVLILPKRVELSREVSSIASQQTQEAASMIRSRAGDETFALREHSPGDALRSVAWRASARMARPIVRDLSKRTGGRVWVVLDDAVGEEHREAFERAVMMTSSMLDSPGARANQVGFATISRGVLTDSRRDVVADVDAMLAALEPAVHVANFVLSQIQPRDAVLLISPNSRGRSVLSVGASRIVVMDPQAAGTYASGELPEVQWPLSQTQRSLTERIISTMREPFAMTFGSQSQTKATGGGV